MKEKNLLTTGIVLSFLGGIVVAIVLLQSEWGSTFLRGQLVETPPPEEQVEEMTGCNAHEECPVGMVCKEGECFQADSVTCSQPFMLAESFEGRFVRYTECPARCITSGESAFCE